MSDIRKGLREGYLKSVTWTKVSLKLCTPSDSENGFVEATKSPCKDSSYSKHEFSFPDLRA